jgi:hypothetical protein
MVCGNNILGWIFMENRKVSINRIGICIPLPSRTFGYVPCYSACMQPLKLWFCLLVACSTFKVATASQLLPPQADWKYFKGVQEASSPDTTAWRRQPFNDGAWLTGSAPFFYGDPFTPGTVLGDMMNNYTTLFFRKTFTYDKAQNLLSMDFDVLCDDGFVAWLNGKIVASNLPPVGPIAFNSLAGGNEAPDPAVFKTYKVPNPRDFVINGENLLAVQVFNVSPGSTDIAFDAQILVEESEPGAPQLVNVIPLPATVTNLTQVTVVFSESVTGINASDLLINDIPATGVTGSGTTYTFTFPQPALGNIQFVWDFNHGIQDLDSPPNLFDRAGANATFVFDLIDPTVPFVAFTHPPAGLTVKRLQEVEVNFNKVVEGVDAGDLLINGQPATNLVGTGAGPYIFYFPQPPAGPVQIRWLTENGIVDVNDDKKRLESDGWNYTVNPQFDHGTIRIAEILCANETGLRDEDTSNEDWIELHNPGAVAVNLKGWSLSDDQDSPGEWVFPDVTIQAGARLVLFASGKDKKEGPRLHTNFKLGAVGEYLGLFSPDSPRAVIHEFKPEYPEQRNDISYGIDANGRFGYFPTPTPGTANPVATITNTVEKVHFSVTRGFFTAPFQLSLATSTPGAVIRYTRDGSEPTLARGTNYSGPITVTNSSVFRAAAFKTNHLPSITETHTYLFNIPNNRRLLPALSIVTGTNNLYGTTGIMESNPRNTTKHGIAWERPISMELIRPEDNGGFQINAGLRVAGGDYIRGLYEWRTTTPPQGKYSFRVYFRGDYGDGKLEYPFFPGSPLESFDAIQLRAGMNDHTNPFLKDEVVRALHTEMGHVAAHGTFVSLFLNGVYKGYYNPTERLDRRFLHAWHGGSENWDLIGAMNQVIDGDSVAWNALKTLVNNNNPTNPVIYQQIEQKLDIQNFIDYLLPQIYADNDDWPHNNTRAGRERTPNGKFRFYIWDTEFAFSNLSRNTIANQLSSTSPPWGTTDYQRMFNSLKRSQEFKLLFADRVHKYFYNGGALTDEQIRKVYDRVKGQIAPSISGFNNTIGTGWIPGRRRYVTNHFATAGFLASSNAPVLSQFGGRVPRNFPLKMSAPVGKIYYTTNGVDPRVRFTSEVSSQAQEHTGADILVGNSFLLKARSLNGTNWSAVTEAAFQVEQLGIPLRFSEIMYNPPGGDAFEFIEIVNIGGAPIDLGGMSLDGVGFRFPEDTPLLQAGGRILLASAVNPTGFALRYGSPPVTGYFTGALSNGGEQLSLKDVAGNVITSVKYDDEFGWSLQADGNGYSLELIDPLNDANAASSWKASSEVNGSPGRANGVTVNSFIRLNEVLADNQGKVRNGETAPDYVELYNSSDLPVGLAGWSLTDNSNARRYVFPEGAFIAGKKYLVVWLDSQVATPGLHAGFSLESANQTVSLFNPEGLRADAVSFGWQLPDLAIGRDSTGEWRLCEPTPGTINDVVTVADQSSLAINEFLANSASGQPDWIEIYNRDTTAPAAIGGIYLGLTNVVSRVTDLSFIAPGAFATVLADEEAGGNHLFFKLPAGGGTIILSDSIGAELSRVTYGAQQENVSMGRLPDGSGSIVPFPSSASPGASNYIPTFNGPVLNEVFASNGLISENGRIADWLEIYNPLTSDFDLGGFGISLAKGQGAVWSFATGTTIPALSYIRIWADPDEGPSNEAQIGFNLGRGLDSRKGGVYLITPLGQVSSFVEYGFQVPNKSIGLSAGAWSLLTNPTPAAANQLPSDLGDIAALRINEWMAAPTLGDDWFEIYNPGSLPVSLSRCSVTDDPSLSGKTNTVIAPLSYISANGFVLFQADGNTDTGADHTGFSLHSMGETLRLYSSAGAVIDEVNYFVQQEGISEGRLPDGGSQISAFPGAATPGSPNIAPAQDSDGDGMPDEWETRYQFRLADNSDAAGDADGDGLSNLHEFRAGTNPRDPESNLALDIVSIPNPAVALRFTAQANRSYTVLFCTDLSRPDWKKVFDIDPGAAERQLTVLDPGSVPSEARFYQLITPKVP